MKLRASLIELKEALAPFVWVILFLGIGALIIWLLPGRAAAILLGVLGAAAFWHFLVRRMPRAHQLATLWAIIAVSADAAYAKLNDQTPVTMANALMKLAEGAAKLADSIVKGAGITAVDTRLKIATVIPDFVWALILCSILLVWLGLSGKDRQTNAL